MSNLILFPHPKPYLETLKCQRFAAILSVALLSKFFLLFQNTKVKGAHNLYSAIELIHKRPIITVINHNSILDEPLALCRLLSLKHFLVPSKIRFALGAVELTFTNTFTKWLFARGQTIPIYRGSGICQPGMQVAIDVLNENGWVHVYPEGRVYQDDRVHTPLKWGTAHLILKSKITPLVIPIIHRGFDKLYPLGANIPRLFCDLSIECGIPMDFESTIRETRLNILNNPNQQKEIEREKRIEIMNRISHRMIEMKNAMK